VTKAVQNFQWSLQLCVEVELVFYVCAINWTCCKHKWQKFP